MTMIEQVARAIYEARLGGGNWDVLRAQRNNQVEIMRWITMARAAITAMREISDDVLAEGTAFLECDYDLDRTWRAMINKALEEQPSPDTKLAQQPGAR